MLRNKLYIAALVATVLMPAWNPVAAQSKAPVRTDGGRLVGTNGMTLYTYDNDTAGSGKSACNGPCAENWPSSKAAAADQGEGDYGIVTRDDGSKQWAYKGKPLYFWAKDAKPGETSGDGVKGVWHTAKP
jgi:predicted lipoprotein with Yx(FWY)xxD motif